MKKYQLKNKYGNWALITGASSGIGESFAKYFASEGLNLILIARREDNLKKLADELFNLFNIKILILPLDITSKGYIEKIKNIVDKIEIGIIVNNAGFGAFNKFLNINTDVMTKMIMLNCIAPVEITSHFLTGMKERKKGAIIFVASIVGYQPVPNNSVYSATKAFDLLFGESLWYELKEFNIDVITVSPGGTFTEFQKVAGSKQKSYYRTTEQVVETTLTNLGKKSSVVDGWFNKIMVWSNRFLPRKSAILIAAKIVKLNEKN